MTDWTAFRSEFPVTERYAYLNNAGVAPLCRPAAQAMAEFTQEALEHGAFRYSRIHQRVEAVRDAFAGLIGAERDEIAMVANTSDGLSLVANGVAWRAGDRVLVPEHEFPANVYPWLALESQGVKVERIPFVDGRCPPEHIAKYLRGARLLSVSAVSFANGFRFDLEAIGRLCRENNVLFCVDGIQALGALELNVKQCDIDFLSADGHKWLTGPEGAGCFYIAKRRWAEVQPSKIGWKNVMGDLQFSTIDFRFKENAAKFEEGTPNVPGFYGLAAAIGLLQKTGVAAIEARIAELTSVAVLEIAALGYTIRSPRQGRDGSGIVSFTGGDNHDLRRMAAAQEAGILMAHRAGALRISPHAYNDAADLEKLFRVLAAERPS